MSETIDAVMVHVVLSYNSDTGEFSWKERKNDEWFNSRFAGKEAGGIRPSGYKHIGVTLSEGHKVYLAHRLAWLCYYGEWPKHTIDHIDQNPLNNAIANLRDVPIAENNKNKTQRFGESKTRGVHKARNKWVATRIFNGVVYRFGNFSTIEEAAYASEEGVKRILVDPDFELLSRKYKKPKKEVRNEKISHEELLSLYRYEQQTGKFYRRKKAGFSDLATNGSKNIDHENSYLRISINGKRYSKHVLAWFYVTGKWPQGVIDHIDGDPANNQFSNLRDTTYSQNALNRKSNINRGVRQTRNKIKRWEASITYQNTRHHLGTFNTREEAGAAWQAFVDQHCPEFIR